MTTTTAKLTPEIMSDLLAEIECDESERVYFLRKQLTAAGHVDFVKIVIAPWPEPR